MSEDVSVADKQRKASGADMLRSMALIIIPIALIMWLLTNNLNDYPVDRVEWRPVLEEARETMDWPVQAPEGLPESGENAWVPSRVSFWTSGETTTGGQASPRNHWRVGFLSPAGVYVEVNQGDDRLDEFIRDVSRDGRRVGEEPIAGKIWERWQSADGRTKSLVLRQDPTVTVVTADAEFTDLQQFARTLEAA